MTWIDLLIALSLIGYTALGALTRTWRRVIGFAALYAGIGAATYVAPRAAAMLQQNVSYVPLVDARVYSFFGCALLVLLILEGISAAYHRQLEISYVAVDYGTGVLLGAFTGVVVAALILVMLEGASKPSGGSDGLQIRTHDALVHSRLAPLVYRTGGRAGAFLLRPVLPRSAVDYFQFDPAPPS